MPRLIITHRNAQEQIELARQRANLPQGLKYQGCYRRKAVYGSIPGIHSSQWQFPRIPRKHWKDLITQGKGTWLGDLTRPILPPHDQNGTNYCWAHGSVRAVEALRVYEGQTALILSAESVAVPLTGGRNRGGSPDEALDQLRTYGACDQTYWPLNDLNIRHAKTNWQTDAANHIILNWADVGTFDDQMTLALHRIPVAIGLAWWGHLVCQLDPILLDDGTFGIGIDNSWGPDWGENGYGILDEEHGTADLGAFAPISETFSKT